MGNLFCYYDSEADESSSCGKLASKLLMTAKETAPTFEVFDEYGTRLDSKVLLNAHVIERMIIMCKHNRHQCGLPPTTDALLEKIVLLIYDSMEAPSRTFHNIDHIRDLNIGADPIQQTAISYHDVIYYQVDGGLSDSQREYLDDIIVEDDGLVSVTEKKLDQYIELVMDIFGVTYGQVLDQFKGKNEFLSTCLGIRSILETWPGPSTIKKLTFYAKFAACIEATIPFRPLDKNGKTSAELLFERLKKVNSKYELEWDENEIVKVVQRAVDLGNRDLKNFSWQNTTQFLSNTWKLLPESNISLRHDSYYLYEMTHAMKKMTGFFETLNPETIYLSFRDASNVEAVIRKKTAQAKLNIDIALIYMRCKVIKFSILSAIAELSGGDVPLCFFIGDRPVPGKPRTKSIVDYLDMSHKETKKASRTHHHDVMTILRDGGDSEVSFDMKKDLFSEFVYSRIGNEGLEHSVQYAVYPMNKENAILLLESIESDLALKILSACAEMAATRRSRIKEIMDKLCKKDLSPN